MVGMKNRYSNYIFYLLASALLLIASCSVAQTVTSNDINTDKGYLLFYNDELAIFLHDTLPSKKISFEKLSQLKGKQIRGADNYPMYLAKKKAKKYTVQEHTFDREKNKSYLSASSMRIIPVTLSYATYSSVEPEKDNGIPFDYKGRHYLINYTDDWDVAIKDVKIIK